MKIRPQPIEYPAIQWGGNNSDEVIKFFGAFQASYTEPLPDRPAKLRMERLGFPPIVLHPGDWLVQKTEKSWSILHPDEFEAKFEVVPSED